MVEVTVLVHRGVVLKVSEESISKAAEKVRSGGIVVYPTDTVYGLGCNPYNVEAVRRLIKVKGERRKPLPILASDLNAAARIADFSREAKLLASRFWPGPLTLVLKSKGTLPPEVTSGLNTVGVRVPDNVVALKLIRLCGGLLVGTSANKTGAEPPRSVQEAFKQLGEEVDLYLDGGVSRIGVSSTVLDLTSGKPKVLREGPVKIGDLLKLLDTL
ncbi:threonylcarbamoyl-AMP synthase [Candidatus Bathyarchaeota archaeon B24-2]|nr:MAG: threonylcarbamoyl-AMP synthase [Candidatus Bathyarchaeota archaeon B24-2]